MQTCLDCVRAFHEAKNVSHEQEFPTETLMALDFIAGKLLDMSMELESRINEDGRFLRAHLMIEELGELVQSMARGEVVDTLDGLADLCYVVLGTAVMYNLPLAEAFAEVHRSNMTKTRRSDDPGRIRDKGATFDPPNIKRVLEHTRPPQFMSFPVGHLSGEQRQTLLEAYQRVVSA